MKKRNSSQKTLYLEGILEIVRKVDGSFGPKGFIQKRRNLYYI